MDSEGEGTEGKLGFPQPVHSGCERLQIGRLQLHANSLTDASTPSQAPRDHPPPQLREEHASDTS